MKRTGIAVFVFFVLGVASFAGAQAPAADAGKVTVDSKLGMSTIELWPSGAPGALGTAAGDVPTLTAFTPRHAWGDGTAVIVAPGGAYKELSADLEGREVADWFAARGVTAFVLRYRLGAKYPYPIPMNDAMRAVRYVRFNAAKYGLDANRIGMMGFSAGGHLTAMVGTTGGPGDSAASDPIDRVSSRPDFLILGYPWLNAMQPNTRGLITYCSVLAGIPRKDCPEFEKRYTPVDHVTKETPPTFIYITSDDETVDVSASVAFYAALRAAGVSVEFHSFAHGSHGSGLGSGDPSLDLWPTLLDAWMRGQGFLPAGR
jgi:acetyl esterase/lipase